MTSNSSVLSPSTDLSKVEATILAVVNVVFSFFGVLGNILVFVVLSRTRTLRTVTNLFIASLAIADLLACAVAQPMYAGFLLGLTVQRVTPAYAQVRKVFAYVSLLASISSLSVVTVDRYMTIASPMNYHLRAKVKSAAILLCGVWLFSLGLGIPCGVVWSVQRISVYYTITQICIIIPIYIRIYLIARNQARTIARLTGHIRKDLRTRSERENIAAKTIGNVLAVFVICWLPLIILPIIFRHGTQIRSVKRALKWSQTLALCSSALNPVIYSLKTETFKKELKKIYRTVFRRRSWEENTFYL